MPRKKGQTVTPKTEAEKAAAKLAAEKERRERFLGTRGAGRGANAIKAIVLWGEVANRASYDFTAAEIAEVNDEISDALETVKAQFAAALAAPGPVASADIPAFSFLKPATPEPKKEEKKKAA